MYLGIGGVQRYLEEKGLSLVDIGSAMVCYEMIGLLIMVFVWWLCFVIQPVHKGLLQPLIQLFRGKDGNDTSKDNGMMGKADRFCKGVISLSQRNFESLARRIRVDPVRLTTAYAEGSVFRSICKPLLLPLKLYTTYVIISSDAYRIGRDYMISVSSMI
jgi:hypothetical protein